MFDCKNGEVDLTNFEHERNDDFEERWEYAINHLKSFEDIPAEYDIVDLKDGYYWLWYAKRYGYYFNNPDQVKNAFLQSLLIVFYPNEKLVYTIRSYT